MKIKKRYYIILYFLLIFNVVCFSQNEKSIVKDNNNIHNLKSSEKRPINTKDNVVLDSNKNSKQTPTLSPYSVTQIESDNVKKKNSKAHSNKKVELKSHAIYNSEEKVINEANKK